MTNNQKPQKIGVAYIRESTEEQDKGFSPEAQEKSIKEYAKKNNIKITKLYKDLVSGRSAQKRGDFRCMIEDAMQAKFEVIIVFHTSRFARNVEESRQYKNLLRGKLNIDVVSSTQSFGDFNDPSAFLNEGINELFDEHYSRQLGFWVKSALMQKRSQGKPTCGRPPFGYEKKKTGWDNNKDKPIYSEKWDINKKETGIVKRVFKMYSSGSYSMQQIAEVLAKEGHKTKLGNLFTYSSIKCMISNKTYLGLVYSLRKQLPDIKSILHKPIISKTLFNKCQDVLKERRGKFGRPVAKHRFYLLQGLVYCYGCIKRMKENETKKNKVMQPTMHCEYQLCGNKKGSETYFYSCKFRKEDKSCKQKKSKCEIVDKQVIEFMSGIKIPNEIVEMILDKLRELFKHSRKEQGGDKNLFKVLNKKKRLKVMFENGHISEEEYLFKMQKADEEISHLERQGIVNSMTVKQQEQYIKETKKFLKDFGKFWKEELSPEEMREWIRATIKRIWVKNDKVMAIEPKDDFKGLFSAYRKVIGQAPLLAQKKQRGNFFI